jgi:hypothetical protein
MRGRTWLKDVATVWKKHFLDIHLAEPTVFSQIFRAFAILAGVIVVLILGAHILAQPSVGSSDPASILNQPLYAVLRLDTLVLPAMERVNQLLTTIPGYSWLLTHVTAGHPDVLQRFPSVFLLLLVCAVDLLWTLLSFKVRVRVNFDAASAIKTRSPEAGKHAVRQPGQPLSKSAKDTQLPPKK